jgi:hypothetical protein
MRIDNSSFGNVKVGHPASALPPAKLTRSAKSASSAAMEKSAQPATLQLADLLARVREEPEVRPDVIRQVQQRLQQGEYLTAAAAAATADRMLQSGD